MTSIAVKESKKPSFTDVMTSIAINESKKEKMDLDAAFSKGLPFALAHLAIKDMEAEAPIKQSAEVAFLRDITHKQNIFENSAVTLARAANNYWKAKH